MQFFGKMGKGISNFLGGSETTQIDPRFGEMSYEELLTTLPILDQENRNLKDTLNHLSSENEFLKNSMINDKESSSGLKQFYKDMKYTFIDSQKDDNLTKDKCLKDLLYEQYLFYDGIEVDEINFLNKLKIKEDDWSKNKDFFMFKQKIIERNYQQLFKNLIASQLLNEILNKKEGNKEDEKLETMEDIIVDKKKSINTKKDVNEKKKNNKFGGFESLMGNSKRFSNEEVGKKMLEDLLVDNDESKNKDLDDEEDEN